MQSNHAYGEQARLMTRATVNQVDLDAAHSDLLFPTGPALDTAFLAG